MDAMDNAILQALKENARASASAIGKRVNLSVPAVLERLKKLTDSGMIEGYTARISRAKMGLSLLAFVSVRVDGTANIQGFRDTVVRFPCVLECHHMAGEYDYLLKVAVKDTAALEHFLTGQLKTTQGVAGTNTQIVLATMKEEVNA